MMCMHRFKHTLTPYVIPRAPKGQRHGPEKGWKVVKEAIALQYLDGPATKVTE